MQIYNACCNSCCTLRQWLALFWGLNFRRLRLRSAIRALAYVAENNLSLRFYAKKHTKITFGRTCTTPRNLNCTTLDPHQNSGRACAQAWIAHLSSSAKLLFLSRVRYHIGLVKIEYRRGKTPYLLTRKKNITVNFNYYNMYREARYLIWRHHWLRIILR